MAVGNIFSNLKYIAFKPSIARIC